MNKEWIENIEKYGISWLITDLLVQFHEKTREAIKHQDTDMAERYAKAIADLSIAYQTIAYQTTESN